MTPLLNEISISLKNDGSDANCRKWASHIIQNNLAIMDLVELIHNEHPVAMRFSWVLGCICELAPGVVYPAINYFFSKRGEIQIPNFNRSLAKMFFLSGVPDEIEGEAADALFRWLQDPVSNVSTKTYTLSALNKLTIKHPELKNELKMVVEEQLYKNSSSFEKLAMKVMESLT